jgi:hypothetical protein
MQDRQWFSRTKLNNVKLGRTAAIGFFIFALCLAVLLVFGRRQGLTGDEVRYLMYAYSILKNGRFAMTLPEWQQLFLSVTGENWPTAVPLPENGTLINSIYVPMLLAPVAYLFKLQGLRAATLIVGIIGLLYLLRLCQRMASWTSSLLITVVMGFSIPLLPYLHIFYMQTFLFTLVCCAWDRLQNVDRRVSGHLITAGVILLIPFAHISGSALAVALYIALLWQQYHRARWGLIAVLLVLAATAGVTFVSWNIAIYGGITGPVGNTRIPFLSDDWFPNLSMQLFNVRHGLIAYAPVWLLGFAGLWAGTLRGIPLAWQGLVLITIAVTTGIAVDAGESWPARFWVLSMPMLGIGLSATWELCRSVFLRAIAGALIGATLVNSLIFFQDPGLYVENRQSTATYQYLFDKIGLFDFGLMLPVQVDDTVNTTAARNLAIGCGTIVFFLGLAAIRRRSLYAIPAVVLLVAALDLSRVSILPPTEYVLETEPHGFWVRFRTPLIATYVQFGEYAQVWFDEPDWIYFSMTIVGTDGHQAQKALAANQVIAASCSNGVDSITVEGSGKFDFGTQIQSRFVVYRSLSILRNSFSSLLSSC